MRRTASVTWTGLSIWTTSATDVILDAVDAATSFVKGYLENSYGGEFGGWETLDGIPTDTEPLGNPGAPDSIQWMTAQLAILDATESFLSKTHNFERESHSTIEMKRAKIVKKLIQYQNGNLVLPGLEVEVLVDGRSSNFIFANPVNINGTDHAIEESRLGSRNRRLQRSGRHTDHHHGH